MNYDLNRSLATYARPAGLTYVIIIFFGLSAEMFLRATLIDWQNAEATRGAISENLDLFRLALALDLGMAVADLFLALFLFQILRHVDAGLALMAMVFRLVQMVIISMGVMHLYQADLAVQAGQNPLPSLTAHAAGYDLGLLFFGVNTALMAVLLHRARLVRFWLVVALGLSGLIYIFGSITRFVWPDINAAMQMAYLIPLGAEVSLCLWLLTVKAPSPHPA